MTKSPLKGITAAAITPVTPAFEIDTARLAQHIDHLFAEGCSYVSTFGTTGEGASLATGKKVDALRQLVAMGHDMSRQLPAVMTPVLDEAVAGVLAYAELGCRAVLVLPPFYYNWTDTGIAAYFDALIARTKDRTDIDIVLYNIPQLSRVTFSPDLVGRIVANHGSRIAGIKDSTGNLESGIALIERFPQLAIFTGDDRVLPELVRRGGAGMIGGMPNVYARDLRAIYDNPDDAERLAQQALRIAAVDAHGSLLALKAALAHYRQDGDLARPMPPLAALEPTEAAALIARLDASGNRHAA